MNRVYPVNTPNRGHTHGTTHWFRLAAHFANRVASVCIPKRGHTYATTT